MSSYYTTAQLEAMRKERIKKELADTIQKLEEQLKQEHTNEVTISENKHIEMSVFAEDNARSGIKSEFEITEDMLTQSGVQTKKTSQADELDFSSLLFSSFKRPTRLETELDNWLKKVDERPVITEQDEKDRTRLLAELAKTVHNDPMDIEDKLQSVKMHVNSYLQGGSPLSATDKKNMEADYFRYCALCQLLEVKPVEKYPYRIKKEIERMSAVLEARNQNEYIMSVIEDVMTEFGCHVKDDAVLDHTVGQMFSVEGHELCDVFIGYDGCGIMFEPVAQEKEASLEKRKQIESSANSVCAMYDRLEQKAAERGVILKRVYMEPARFGAMCAQSDIRQASGESKKRRTTGKKQRSMKLEV